MFEFNFKKAIIVLLFYCSMQLLTPLVAGIFDGNKGFSNGFIISIMLILLHFENFGKKLIFENMSIKQA